MTYDEAVSAYYEFVTRETNFIFMQPAQNRSYMKRGVWYLANVNGPLARVSAKSGRVIWPKLA